MKSALQAASHQPGKKTAHDSSPGAIRLDRAICLAFEMLSQAAIYAKDAGSDRWQFAVEIEHLRVAGISPCTLRWLMHKGYVVLGEEVTTLRDNERCFRERSASCFRDSSCFMLTDRGVVFAVQLKAESASAQLPIRAAPGGEVQTPPNWDPLLRELWVGATLVKRFCVPAPNQERILCAFMEEKWPLRIDDPLPPVDGMEPKRRLQAAIMCLNRNQRVRVIRFRGNGKGNGIRWEFNSILSEA